MEVYMTQSPVREAPALNPLTGRMESTPDMDASDEPILRANNIQGNILGGFNKDFQTLLFLEIEQPDSFRQWLQTQIPFIATASEVIAFNRLFKSA
jgi:hypothetical protein